MFVFWGYFLFFFVRALIFRAHRNPLGSIHQEWTTCTPLAESSPSGCSDDVVLRIEGPVCAISCGDDVVFKVLSEDSSVQVGTITKQWRGLCAEAFTDADNFGLSVPVDMDVRTKALLLGALFLIRFSNNKDGKTSIPFLQV
ncbi:Phospholipid scramblase 3 [Chionoecetes opilio]|uniref:Phospholipid scramblase n=1 Tax=Chionoecetes opilio TaxID=41210 RepID=A0A8J4XT01_CHIOP|nr:Phospholipid scramblase 3 [Chionoecetes opilio]